MRIPPQGIEMLAQRPLFAGLSRKELESVAALGFTVEVTANQVLTKEGRGVPHRVRQRALHRRR